MQIEIGLSPRGGLLWLSAAAVVFLLIGFFTLGWLVTPWEADQPQVVSPERWQGAALERKARSETIAVQFDLVALHNQMEESKPDPVQAMLLAQRIYGRQHNGTSATASVRQALVDAAAAVARYASGSITRDEAAIAINQVSTRLAPLLPEPTPTP